MMSSLEMVKTWSRHGQNMVKISVLEQNIHIEVILQLFPCLAIRIVGKFMELIRFTLLILYSHALTLFIFHIIYCHLFPEDMCQVV